MKAMLVDGSIIELKKDCSCEIHEGPHWLYTDQLWKNKLSNQLNNMKKNLEPNYTNKMSWLCALSRHIGEAHISRLQELERNMKQRNIVEIIPDDSLSEGKMKFRFWVRSPQITTDLSKVVELPDGLGLFDIDSYLEEWINEVFPYDNISMVYGWEKVETNE